VGASAQVTGTIGLKLYKGSARVVSRSSPHAVYDAQLATFAESGGLFSQEAAPGFIELHSLQSRMAWRLRHGESDQGHGPSDQGHGPSDQGRS
jgi:argininosuccinate synthase